MSIFIFELDNKLKKRNRNGRVIIKSHRERSVMIWAVQCAPECGDGEPDKGIIGVGVWAKKSGKGSM